MDDVDATELRIVRAESLLKLERPAEAEADLDAAIHQRPDHLHAYVHRCDARRLQVRAYVWVCVCVCVWVCVGVCVCVCVCV